MVRRSYACALATVLVAVTVQLVAAVPANANTIHNGSTPLVGALTANGATGANRSDLAQDKSIAAMRAQAPRLEAATAIQELASAKGLDGFTATALEGDKLVLFWHGAVPAQVSDAVAGYAQKFPVEVRPAAYSQETLLAEAYRLSLQPGVTGAGALADFNGLWVGVGAAGAANTFGPRQSLPASSLPVVARTMGAPVNLSGRWADSEAFWGGGAIVRSNGAGCSTGFAARRVSNNQEVMTTARHCGTGVQWKTPAGLVVGTSSAGVTSSDAMYISGKDYGASVFTGAWNSTSSVKINGYVSASRGTMVYEGAYSGAKCNQNVVDILVFAGGAGPGFWTENSAHQSPAGHGDSGGPVLAGSSGSGLNGIGVITQGGPGTEAPCRARPTASVTGGCSTSTSSRH